MNTTGLIKQFNLIDPKTGEVLLTYESIGVSDNGKGWSIVYQTTDHLLATDATLKFADVRIYLHIRSNIDYECKYSSTQSAMAEELGLSNQQVSNSLKVLREKDFLRQQRVHGQLTFYINPMYATRGKDKRKLLDTYESIPLKVSKKRAPKSKCKEPAQTS